MLFNAENKNHQERFILFGIIRLSDLDRGGAIGLLDSGLGIKSVSIILHATPKTIKKYKSANIELLVRSKIGHGVVDLELPQDNKTSS